MNSRHKSESIVTTRIGSAPYSAAPRVARGVLILLTFAACCWAAYGVGKFLAERRIAPQPLAVPQVQADDLSPLAAALPLAGMWSFDELEWKISSQLLSRSDVQARLEMLASTPPISDDSQLPMTDPEIVELIAALQLRPEQRFDNEVYRIDRTDIELQLVTRQLKDGVKTVAFAVAYPHAGDVWQLYEFVPKSVATDVSSAAPHLLPLPKNARRSGGRYAADGQVLLELVSLTSSTEKLTADWRRAGWQVRPSGLASSGEFSYLCARGDETIYAWSADPPTALRNVMLVRSPSSADSTGSTKNPLPK